jgi:hypothetical protein
MDAATSVEFVGVLLLDVTGTSGRGQNIAELAEPSRGRPYDDHMPRCRECSDNQFG